MKATRVPRSVSGGKNALDPNLLAAYRIAVRRYAHQPWVTGVGIGIRERRSRLVPTEGPVIAIHVRNKASSPARVARSRRIPKLIRGVPTDVIEADYQLASGGGLAAAAAGGALCPGHSIARADGTAATLGGVVLDAANVPFLLCAAHTLREGNKGKKGDSIVHPGPLDAGGTAPAVVAAYQGVHFGMDAGLARLNAGVNAINTALVSGVAIGLPAVPALGDILEKSGRSTGITQAVVQTIGTFLNIFPAVHLSPLSGDIDATPLSASGDSGALWYDAITGEGKALHSSGSGVAPAGHEFGVAAMLPFVLDALKVRWAQGLVTG